MFDLGQIKKLEIYFCNIGQEEMRPSKFKQNPNSEHDYYFSVAALRVCLGDKAERRIFW
jgi:hypothetical protein|tara:strand:- start:1105 stop:1281 length:177 start_codon:yes stop_codon:yes gene_type:complete